MWEWQVGGNWEEKKIEKENAAHFRSNHPRSRSSSSLTFPNRSLFLLYAHNPISIPLSSLFYAHEHSHTHNTFHKHKHTRSHNTISTNAHTLTTPSTNTKPQIRKLNHTHSHSQPSVTKERKRREEKNKELISQNNRNKTNHPNIYEFPKYIVTGKCHKIQINE